MDWEVRKYPMYYGDVKQPYSKSAVVGNLVLCSSMDARNLDTGKVESKVVEEQTTVCLDKVRIAMEEAGGSMNNIVKTVILVKNVKDIARIRKAELDYYQKHAPFLREEPPASIVMQTVSLESPESLVEIDATGVIDRYKSGWEVQKYPMYSGGVKQPYSKSAVVGNLIFLSGMAGVNLDTGKVESGVLEEQMAMTHDNVRVAMEEAGSCMSNIVHTFHLLNEPEVRRMWRAELDYYEKYARPLIEEDSPASTYMQLPSLSSPEYLTEIEIIGAISRNKPGWEVKKYAEYIGDDKAYYSKSVVVGNLIIISGMTGQDKFTGKIETPVLHHQARIALDKIKEAMEEAGSSLNNILKQIILIPKLETYPYLQKIMREYYQKHAPFLIEEPPAHTVIQPTMLAWPPFALEIITIGVITRDGKGAGTG